MSTDERLSRLCLAWRRARITEANELGAIAGVRGVVRALSPEEWRLIEERRAKRES